MFVPKKRHKNKRQQRWQRRIPLGLVNQHFYACLANDVSQSAPLISPLASLSAVPSLLFIFCTSHLLCRRFTPKLS